MAARFPDWGNPQAIDTHAHVSMADFDIDRDAVIRRAAEHGVDFIEVGFDSESSLRALALARAIHGKCAVGVHPHNAGESFAIMESQWREVTRIASGSPEVAAIGEIGLDYARDFSPRDVQVACFEQGIHLARTLGLPAVIHQRDAEEQVVEMVSGANLVSPVVFHCFGGGVEYARKLLDLGGYLGLGGVLTYPKNGHVRDAVKEIPLDRILLETDCPYLSPQPLRGKRNEPSHLLVTAKIVADIRGIGLPELLAATTANAAKVFLGKPTWRSN